MGNRLGEKKGVGSPSHWLYSSLSAFPAPLLISCLMMVSGVGAECVKSLKPRPGQVLVMCPLTENVSQTKRSVFIKRFPPEGDAVTVFSCGWQARDSDTPDCHSLYNFTLEDLRKDCVVASVPRTLLQNDSYTCMLVPQDKDQPFTTCRVLHSDDAEDPPTTISAVTPSTAADQPQPRDQKGANGDHPWGLVAAVVALSFTVFILLLMVIIMAVLFLRLKIYRKRSYSSSSSSSDDDLILRAKRREEEEKKNEVEKQRLMTQTLVDTWGQEDMVVYVPDATCEAENDVSSEGARQATTPDSETSSTNSEHYQGSPLLGKDENPKLTMWNFDDLQRTRH